MLLRVLGVLLALLTVACNRRPRGASGGGDDPTTTAQTVVLRVNFSSEKKDWAQEALRRFQATNPRAADGRAILVTAQYQGSVEPLDGIAAGTTQPHVFSPASSVVIPMLNERWQARRGAGSRPVAGAAEALVLSPVVVALWRPMAEALGWPARHLGWTELAQLATSPQGWRAHGHPEWGDFRFGHTHPAYSNSGLIAVLAMNYAAASKTRDLTLADVDAEATRTFVRNIESAVVHYGRSTGLFYDELAEHGPGYLSAAVVYENLVVAPSRQRNLALPLVCVYPREGTLWADHPYVVLDAPWVGPAERDAAGRLRAFLLSQPMQALAMERFGFRPASTDLAIAAPIDAAHGADPREPQTLLATPEPGTLRQVLDRWNESKRSVELHLVFDRSGSMQGAPLESAREGLTQFLRALHPSDRVVLVTFSDLVDPLGDPQEPSAVLPRAQGIFASGGTALYDAVDRALTHAEARARTDRTRIHALVVLTDGEDRNSLRTFPQLLERIHTPESGDPVRIFTIGYGPDANESVLRQLATRTGGTYTHGDASNIRAIYDEIAAFF
jgi:Ca-activated chloride channel family protein